MRLSGPPKLRCPIGRKPSKTTCSICSRKISCFGKAETKRHSYPEEDSMAEMVTLGETAPHQTSEELINVMDELARRTKVNLYMDRAERKRTCNICHRPITRGTYHLRLPKSGFAYFNVCPPCARIAARIADEKSQAMEEQQCTTLRST